MNRTLLLAAATAAALTASFTASATVLTAVYKGTVKDGSDQIGLFGTAGGNLSGDAYVARYTYDTANGVDQLPISYEVDAVWAPGFPSTFNATLTINGITTYLPSWYGNMYGGMFYFPPLNNELLLEVGEQHWSGDILTQEGMGNDVYDISGYGGDTILATRNVKQSGYANFRLFWVSGVQQGTFYDTQIDLSGDATLTIGTGSVPEPATWVLMLGGFGMAGSALRRRRPRLNKIPS